MPWPPEIGEMMPRASEAIGIEEKLRNYTLEPEHENNRGKARGFSVRLGIDLDSIGLLEAEIRSGIRRHPISSVRSRQSYGVNLVVEFEISGVGRYIERSARIRTVWQLRWADDRPRFVTAFLK